MKKIELSKLKNLICSLFVFLSMMATSPYSQAFSLLDTLGIGGSDGTITKIKYRLRENFSPTDVAWSSDGNYIASASTQSSEIHIWDVKKNEIIKILNAPFPHGWGKGMVWTADSHHLLVCREYGKIPIVIYSIDTGEIAKQFLHKDGIACSRAVSSPDNSKIVITGNSNIAIINANNFEIINQFEISKQILQSIKDSAWIPGSENLVIGDYGKYEDVGLEERKLVSRVFKLDTKNKQIINNTVAYGTPYFSDITVIAASPDGKLFATGTNTGSGPDLSHLIKSSVHIFDTKNFNLIAAPMDNNLQENGNITGLDFSADGKYLIFGHFNEAHSPIYIFDTKSLQITDTAYSPTGVRALSSQKNGKLFAIATGQHIIIFELN